MRGNLPVALARLHELQRLGREIPGISRWAHHAAPSPEPACGDPSAWAIEQAHRRCLEHDVAPMPAVWYEPALQRYRDTRQNADAAVEGALADVVTRGASACDAPNLHAGCYEADRFRVFGHPLVNGVNGDGWTPYADEQTFSPRTT